MREEGGLARKTAAVSAAAAGSRILGFLRDVLIAALLGAGPVADAFVAAFRIPSLIRRVLGEGALNAGVVPVLARLRDEGGEAAEREAAGRLLAVAALWLSGGVAVAMALAPWIVLGMAAGFADEPGQWALSTWYARLMLPLAATAVLSAVAAAILNAQSKVAAAALAPLAVNAVLVATLLALSRAGLGPEATGTALAAAVSVAGLAQLLVLVPFLARLPSPPRLVAPRLTPGIRRMVALGLPGVAVVAAGQVAIVVATQVASQEPSAVARLYYAERLFSLPLGFVAAAAGTVLLPELARLLREGDEQGVHAAQNRSLEWALLLALPATAGLVLLAEPIVSVLFERGAFGGEDTRVTAACLAALAAGLPAAAVVRVLSQGCFARENVVLPLWTALAGVAATLVLALGVVPVAGAPGVAAAVSAGSWLAAGLLALSARRRGWHRGDPRLAGRVVRTLAATAAMAAAVAALHAATAPWLEPSAALVLRAATLAVLCGGGSLVFVAAAVAAGAIDRADLRRLR